MKNASLFLSVLLAASTLNGFAKEAPVDVKSSSTIVLNSEPASDKVVYRLTYQSEVKGNVRVCIYNESGSLLMEDRIKNVAGFTRPYNFCTLPAGKYSMVIEDAKGKETKQIYHGIASVEALALAKKVKVSILALDNPAKYELSVVGSRMQPVEVRIYDASKTLIFTEEIAEAESFNRVYDFSKLNRAGLSMEVVNGEGVLHSVLL
jgi:hypothetical protein